jgi:cysteine synthase
MNDLSACVPTPLQHTRGNIRTKLELLNPGGSHKTRAARRIIQRAIAAGELTPGGTRRILEKSGGNFGVGLAYEAAKHDIGVDLVIGLSFSPLKRALCEEFGARLVGIDQLKAGLQPKEVINNLLQAHPQRYFFPDQFSNQGNIDAHLLETGPELADQLDQDMQHYQGCVLVLAAGTGASASALAKVIRERFDNVRVVLNEPHSCCYEKAEFGDHVQKGTAVGVAPPFLDLTLMDEIVPVTDAQARAGQRQFALDTGIYPGPSSGGNYFIATQLSTQYPDHLIVTLAYDGGEGYLDSAITEQL